MSLARAAISGVLVTDPEKRFTPNNTAVTNFSIEVTGSGRNESPFVVQVACWRGLAEVAAEQLRKGMEVLVEGRLQVNQFDQGGMTRRNYEIDATNVAIGHLEPLVIPSEQQGSWQGANNAPQQTQQQPVAAAARTSAAPAYPNNQSFNAGDESLTEDDIPF